MAEQARGCPGCGRGLTWPHLCGECAADVDRGDRIGTARADHDRDFGTDDADADRIALARLDYEETLPWRP